MIYLYALTEATAWSPDCTGLDEQTLAVLEVAGLGAVYSRHDNLDRTPSAEALWRHDQVVERAMSAGATLPVRFGTTFERTEAMIAVVERESGALRARLDRVRGCVELAVRLALPADRGDVVEDGRGYLEARLASERRREATTRRTLAPLGALAVGVRELRRAGREAISASFLVRAGDVESFAAEVRSLRDTEESSISCTGPWPPYSFVDSEDST